jgi:large subunit ribosomal protein L10
MPALVPVTPGTGSRVPPDRRRLCLTGGRGVIVRRLIHGVPFRGGPFWREQVERAEKAELVASLNAVFQTTGSVVVSHNLGLTVAQVNDLRGRMAKAGATVKVAKNRLAKLALDGTPATGLADLFKGPTMVAYAADPVAAPKVATEFARQNDKFVVLGGTLGGSRLDAQGVKALADLPSLDELRARLVGMIQTPATRLAVVLQAPGSQLARVLKAYADKDNASVA